MSRDVSPFAGFLRCAKWVLLFLGPLVAFQWMNASPSIGPVRSTPLHSHSQHGVCDVPASVTYTSANLSKHTIPQWFEDAKLGIFIHWGLYSVPGWAPVHHTFGDSVDGHTAMTHNPYAEWYMNTMQLAGSPTKEYHKKTYGDMPYIDFAPMFNKAVHKWKPTEWAELFKFAGAKYAVLTTKHHDGFTLWPSAVRNPHRTTKQQRIDRDVVGELSAAVRAAGLEMGLYYSGGFDWSFDGKIDPKKFMPGVPDTKEYAEYCDAHLKELIQKYRPAVLWDDINYPSPSKPSRLLGIFLDYFNSQCPLGVVNDRWGLHSGYSGDFGTPEYGKIEKVAAAKFELCRGVGRSFGYNRNEGKKEMMSGVELIELLVDVTAKNGNLLLDVGPDAAGTISDLQVQPLRELGRWMAIHQEAIHGTRPFLQPGITPQTKVRYTVRGEQAYCIMMDKLPANKILHLPIKLEVGTVIRILPNPKELVWKVTKSDVQIHFAAQPAYHPFVLSVQHPKVPIRTAMQVLKP